MAPDFLARLLEADGPVGFGDAAGPIDRDQNIFVDFRHSYQRLLRRPPPPPPERSVFGRASLMVRARPLSSVPLSSEIAFSASASLVISTKPNPLGWPVSRSVTMLTRSTDP